MVARLKLKGIDGRAPPGVWSLRLNLTQHGETYQLVERFVWLIPLTNENLSLLTSYAEVSSAASFLEGLRPFRPRKFEAITGL
ncbi:UNVERIFIED_CONTAM: hypothetical protein Sindi_3004300 [Sesamum indicum]